MLETFGAVVVAAATLWFVFAWAKCRAIDAGAASILVDEFYEAAQKLIKDDQTPESVVDFVEFYASQVGRPALARGFATHLVLGRLGKVKHSPNQRLEQFERDLETLKPESAKLFAQMIGTGIVSSAASDLVLSRVYLNAVRVFISITGRAGDETSPERARTVAVDVAHFDRHHAFA